jgi:phage baseplate assembly protein W
MTNAKYLGMARESGRTIEDMAHIRQSVSDILLTPVGSRVMRSEYGSIMKPGHICAVMPHPTSHGQQTFLM